MRRSVLCIGFLLAVLSIPAAGLSAVPGDTPKPGLAQSAQAAGELIVGNLLSRDFMMYNDEALHYSEAATAVGSLRFADATGNRQMLEWLIARYQPLLDENSPLISRRAHVDLYVIGIIPLQIALLTGDERFLELGLSFADRQWDDPQEDGLTSQTRWWIDDLYMVGMLQMQAYQVTGNMKYADRAARQLAAYLPRLQRENGLFFHSPDVPIFWGRGNGWVAVAMAEVLSALPEDNERFGQLRMDYLKMMDSLLSLQSASGMWRQVIDYPESWEESSATAMFAYAMLLGLQNNLLPREPYLAAVEKAWEALLPLLDEDGNVSEVCIGTGKKNDLEYYLSRPRVAGDFHGQAPVLWLATGLLTAQ